MKLKLTNSTQLDISSAIIFHDLEQLAFLQLNESEQGYVQSAIEGEDYRIVRLNRYPVFLHLIKVNPPEENHSAQGEKIRHLGHKTLRMLKGEKATRLRIISPARPEWALHFAEGLALGAYQFLKYYSDADKKRHSLEELELSGVDQKALQHLDARIRGTYKARDLINEPLSFLTAPQLAEEARNVGLECGFSVEVLNKKKIESLKMGGLLAVNFGSIDPPTFTIMEHKPERAVNERPVVLVGKGVVYDTGGLSLKPTANSMDTMKSDMSGAAAVIGTMMAVALSQLPVHVIGLVPATDNRPGENAYVPGDVVKMYDGSTVEVLNTDAEGRMILADALAYAKKYQPELTIDLATLTGSAAIAVGKYGIVAMGTAGSDVMQQLSAAGQEVYERIAELPFWDEYSEMLKSSIADVKNIGGREAGAITAGKFLERFTDYPWVHLDIAGPAFLSGDDHYRLQGGTGVGVRLLHQYLKDRC